eukprot:3831542-Lingulodinium_polyedra.AAC.1
MVQRVRSCGQTIPHIVMHAALLTPPYCPPNAPQINGHVVGRPARTNANTQTSGGRDTRLPGRDLPSRRSYDLHTAH